MTEIAEPARFWRMDDPVLDANGQVVCGGMFDHQREWWNLPNFIRGLVTGYGGGKTMALAKRMIALALHNAPVTVVTVSPTYPMARTTIVESIRELLDGRSTGSGAGCRRRWWPSSSGRSPGIRPTGRRRPSSPPRSTDWPTNSTTRGRR